MSKYKVRLDRILSIDCEFTCWNGPPPAGQRSETIQIGVCEIDMQTKQVLWGDKWYIKNTMSEVSPECTEITGITQSILNKRGVPLSEAARLIEKRGSRNKAFIAWGSDKEGIDRDCEAKGVKPFMSNAFYNVGLLYSMVMAESRAIGLAEAARSFGIEFNGRQHDALVDAEALAHVWCHLSHRLALTGPEFEQNIEASAMAKHCLS